MTTITRTSVPTNTKTDGQHGELRLGLEKRGEKTSLTSRYFTVPFGPTWAIYPPGGEEIPELLVTTPADGILGGDRYEIDVTLGPGASASILTTGANKVYRGPQSRQNAAFFVDDGAFLEYLPHHTIPFSHSSHRQDTEFTLSEGATLLCWEAYSAGRVGRGERFAFSSLANRTRIFRAGVPEVIDGFELPGGGEPFAGYSYTATIYVCAPNNLEPLAERLHTLLAGSPGILASCSAATPEVCVVRVLAQNAPSLYRTLNWSRSMVREVLCMPEPSRKIV